MMRVGFVGLGHMGLPMAINLVKAGYVVTGFDLQASACGRLQEVGGLVAQNLKEVADGQDVLITMLQTGQQVEAVCLSTEGLFASAKAGALVIDCSSIDVAHAQTIHEAAAEYGLRSLDAPVSGGVAGAHAATLTFMIGGLEQTFLAAEPVLQAMGKTIIYTGGACSGQVAKMCNNMVLGVSMIAVSEAFLLAERLGLAPEKLHEVLNHASGRCWVTEQYVPVPNLLEHVPANRAYQPGFTGAMMLKDLRLSQTAAEAVNIHTPMGEMAQTLYESLDEHGMGQLDFSVIIQLLRQTQTNDSTH